MKWKPDCKPTRAREKKHPGLERNKCSVIIPGDAVVLGARSPRAPRRASPQDRSGAASDEGSARAHRADRLGRARSTARRRGRLTELIGRRSSGRTALGLSALAAATRRGETVALVDVDGAFDPRSALACGLDLARLLWVRAGDGRRGLRAVELILGAGGFGVVALDLGERRARVPEVSWLRLSRAAEKSEAALAVIAPWPQAGSFAVATVETSRPRPLLSQAQSSASPRLLRAVTSCVALVRSKRGAPEAPVPITLRLR